MKAHSDTLKPPPPSPLDDSIAELMACGRSVFHLLSSMMQDVLDDPRPGAAMRSIAALERAIDAVSVPPDERRGFTERGARFVLRLWAEVDPAELAKMPAQNLMGLQLAVKMAQEYQAKQQAQKGAAS